MAAELTGGSEENKQKVEKWTFKFCIIKHMNTPSALDNLLAPHISCPKARLASPFLWLGYCCLPVHFI